MHWKEVVSRLTGFSVPIFGVSWNPPEAEVAVARRVVAYLEDRRVLYTPFAWEVPEHCVESVLQIRQFLTEVLLSLPDRKGLAEHVRGMRAACREFLTPTAIEHFDPMHGKRPRILVPRNVWDRSGPDEWRFWAALGELRSRLGHHLGAIAVMYGLEMEDELATILPPKPEETEDENA